VPPSPPLGSQRCRCSRGLCPPQVNPFPGRTCSCGSGPALKCGQAGSAAAAHCFPADTHAPSSGALFMGWPDPEPAFLTEQLFPALVRSHCRSSSVQPSRPMSVCLSGGVLCISFLPRNWVQGQISRAGSQLGATDATIKLQPACAEGVAGLVCSAA